MQSVSIKLSKEQVQFKKKSLKTNFFRSEMDSYERCHTCFFKWIQQVLKFAGHDVLSKDFKIGPYTLFIYSLYVPFIFSIVYTFVAFDAFAKMNVIVLSCLAIQVFESSKRFDFEIID